MKKRIYSIFLLVLVAVFSFSFLTKANAASEAEYEFTAHPDHGLATVENNVVTMAGSKSMIQTDVSNVDLTGDVYISIYLEGPVKNLDIFANIYSESSARLLYKAESEVSKIGTPDTTLTEYKYEDGKLIITCKADDKLAELGIAELTKVIIWLRGSEGNIVTILDFAITTDGKHGFGETTTPEEGGDVEEPTTPSFVFEGNSTTTVVNNVATVSGTSGAVSTSVNVTDLSAVYVSMWYKADKVTGIETVAYGNGDEAVWPAVVMPKGWNVTETPIEDGSVVATANISGTIAGLTAITSLRFNITCEDGATLEILGFEITTDGNYTFDTTITPPAGGDTEEPTTPSFVFEGNSTTTVVNNVATVTGTSGAVVTNVNVTDLSAVYVSMWYKADKVTGIETVAYGNGDEAVWPAVVMPKGWNVTETTLADGSVVATANISGTIAGLTAITSLRFNIACEDGATLEILGFEITTDGNYTFDTTITPPAGGDTEEPETPVEKVPSITEFKGSSALKGTFEAKEDGTTVYTAPASYGSAYIRTQFVDYDTKYPVIAFDVTLSHDMNLYFDYGYSLLHQADYKAGNHVIYIDLSKITVADGTNFQISVDKDREAGDYDVARTITFNSVTFLTEMPKEEYNPNEPTVYSEITSSQSALISTNEKGEQVISYDSSNKPGWHTFNITVSNYNPALKEFAFTYSSNQAVVMCFEINGKYEGHISYPAGENQVARLDFSDPKYNLGLSFTIKIYFDASNATVTEEAKVITVHSYQFQEPAPLPEGIVIGAPQGGGIAVEEANDGWDLSYNVDGGYNRVSIPVTNYSDNYDLFKVSLNATAGTNVGIYVKYKDETGASSEYAVRSHWSEEGLIATTGTHEFVFYLEAFELLGYTVTRVDIYFDAPTSVTTNTGDVTAKLYSVEFYDSTELNLSELEFSLEDIEVDYTGEAVELDIVCDEAVEFKVQHQKVGDTEWYSGVPTTAGEYTLRVSYMGSLEYAYSYIEASLVINKVQYTVGEDEVLVEVDEITRVVTLAEGVEASTSATFEEGKEVANGATIEYGTVIYVRKAADASHTASEYVTHEFVKTLAAYKHEAKAELDKYSAEDYREAEAALLATAVAEGKAAIDAAESVEAIEAALETAVTVIEGLKTDAEYAEEEAAAAAALAEAKATALAELASYKAEADYREAEVAELREIVATTTTAIEAAATIEEVAELLATAKTAMDALKTDAEYAEEEAANAELALANSKTNANKVLNGYKAEDYREAEQALLLAAVADGKAAVEAAETVEAVEAALTAAKAAISAIKTNAEYEAEEALALANAKAAANTALETYKVAADYREAEQVLLATKVENGKAAIEAATTVEAVEAALAAAKAELDTLKTKAEYEAEEAAALALANAKTAAKEALAAYKAADYLEAEQALLAAAVETASAIIEAATTIEAVEAALATAKAELDALKTAATYLSEAKAAALAELAAYKSTDDYREAEAAQLTKAVENGTKAINAATSLEVVEFALTSAKAAIDEIKTKAEYEAEEAAAFAKAQKDAKNEILNYKSYADYREAERSKITDIISNSKNAINAAETYEEIETILTEALAAMDALKTAAEYAAEEAAALAAAKVEAKAAIATAIGTYEIDKAPYEASIDAAESLESLEAALTAAKDDIAAKKAAIDAPSKEEPTEQPEQKPEQKPEENKKGCKGSILPSIFGLIMLLGACVTLRKKYNN